MLCDQHGWRSARLVLSLRIPAAPLSRLSAPRGVAGRILRADEHRRRRHSEAHMRRRSPPHAPGRSGDRAVHDRRWSELSEQRRSRRQSAAARGRTQLHGIFADDGIYAWQFSVDWTDPANSRLTGPEKIAVAPYHYLCDGQLTTCVRQPGTDQHLDAQGDKLMARVVYRNVHGRESIVAVHSVTTAVFGGGVRWYEFSVAPDRTLRLRQQGTYAPDGYYRWMGSPAIDSQGNIGIGYSFGGTPNFAGQRFAGRLAGDPLGVLTLHEAVLAEGQAAQVSTMRWEDYSQTAIDPTDDCTIWYVGDYLKKDALTYSTRIGAFRMCR